MTSRMKISTIKQFETLVAELEKNPSLAKGFRRGTVPTNFKGQWEEIGKKLNSFGPPLRDSDGWQKVWRGFKFKVKKKIVANKMECSATGGGRYKQQTLSPLEETVANMLQFEKQLNPQGAVHGVSIEFEDDECASQEQIVEEIAEEIEVGNIEDFNLDVDMEAPTSTNASAQKKRKATVKKSGGSERQSLLEKHSAMQEKGLADISNILTSVKTIIKDTSRYQRKLLEVEEKKLKLLERRDIRQESLYKKEIEIKTLKILIKKKELEMLNK